MRRPAQGLLITLVGGTLLQITVFSRAYLNYVKPQFHPFLIATGLVFVALGVLTVLRHRRTEDAHQDHGHGHEGAPKAAWLLALPVLAIFLLAPPALGSYTAGRDTGAAPPPARSAYEPLPVLDEPNRMYIGEFVGRSYDASTLSGRQVELIGFVLPRAKGGWYLTRIQISCCAADARAWKIHINGPAPAPRDTWVEVVGTWVPRRAGEATAPPRLTAERIRRIDPPPEPYEEFDTP